MLYITFHRAKIIFQISGGFMGFTNFELSFIVYLFNFVQNNLRGLETHNPYRWRLPCVGASSAVGGAEANTV